MSTTMEEGQLAAATDVRGMPTLRELVLPSLAALRCVWLPFCLLLLCGVAFVVSYYHVPTVTSACESIASLKARFGYGFSAVAGVITGVLLPELFKRLSIRGHRILPRLGEIALDAPYFILMGMTVDGLYRLLGYWFGTQVDVPTVAIKTLIDQFVFTPTLGVGIAAVYFPLRANHWDWRAVFGGFGLAWYVRRVGPLLVTAWCFWLPAVSLVYSLPPLLQFPFSACATAAWSLLMISIARTRLRSSD
jgi:hypothetical protein